MMGYGPFHEWGLNSLLGFANEIVWLIVGILVIMWLTNKMKK